MQQRWGEYWSRGTTWGCSNGIDICESGEFDDTVHNMLCFFSYLPELGDSFQYFASHSLTNSSLKPSIIYQEGPGGNPDILASAKDIRETFSRMGKTSNTYHVYASIRIIISLMLPFIFVQE